MKIISTFNKFRPHFNSILGTSDVRWLSHHIPKTAGTSLRASFDEAFGRRQNKLDSHTRILDVQPRPRNNESRIDSMTDLI